jgi:membrane-associated protein
VNALSVLQVDSVFSYLVAIILPALDAIFPVLPSETVVIALGVATAGSADPRIALLVACAAFGAFLGDNLCYLLGRRFGPYVERRFFGGEKGARRRAWAVRSLDRYGMPLIIVCRFVPGGRTAVTLTCGIVRYDRRRFVIATAIAGTLWASYAFFAGRLGGKAFEDRPWVGLLLAFAGTLAVSGLIEVIRRLRSRGVGGTRPSGRHTRQIQADDAGQDQADRDELESGHRVTEKGHAHDRGPHGTDPRPQRVGGSHLEVAQRDGQQPEAQQRADGEGDGRPRPGQPVAHLE